MKRTKVGAGYGVSGRDGRVRSLREIRKNPNGPVVARSVGIVSAGSGLSEEERLEALREIRRLGAEVPVKKVELSGAELSLAAKAAKKFLR